LGSSLAWRGVQVVFDYVAEEDFVLAAGGNKGDVAEAPKIACATAS